MSISLVWFKRDLRLQDLNRQLKALGTRIHVFPAELSASLHALHEELHISAIYSHEETGLASTFRACNGTAT